MLLGISTPVPCRMLSRPLASGCATKGSRTIRFDACSLISRPSWDTPLLHVYAAAIRQWREAFTTNVRSGGPIFCRYRPPESWCWKTLTTRLQAEPSLAAYMLQFYGHWV